MPLRSGFDHSTDPALVAGHFAEWTRLQAETRAFRSDIAEGLGYDLWYLLRFDDIHDALQDPGLFSSSSVQYLGASSQQLIPEELDPPEHGTYRQLLSRPLSPGNVLKMEDEVRALCASLIDDLVARGGCDVLRDFGLRFPTTVFLKLMGLPSDQVDTFVALAQAVLHTTNDDDPDQAIRGGAAIEIVGHLAAGLEARRAEPRDDLLSQLLAAEVDGEPIGELELYAMTFLLYLAGLDTVANVLAYSFWHLAEHPDQRQALLDDPGDWPVAIEELMRLYSIATTVRVVTRDVEYAGCPMKAGDRVVLPTAAAGRDPAQFERAGELVADRKPNRHLAFGGGPHRCVGAHLARLELRVAMEEWHARIPHYRLAEAATIHEHVGPVAGPDHVPLVWD
ncbi:MAG: Cytochrome [Acidimicrobiales bacterium]|nr:Cytochrome [Acidimicrobiales bacterium]